VGCGDLGGRSLHQEVVVDVGVGGFVDEGVLDVNRRFAQKIMEAAANEAQKGAWGPWEWTLQGLGMLRLYLGTDKQVRLHVWDDRFIFWPTPSELHTHPWHMYSLVIAGEVFNTRYTDEEPDTYLRGKGMSPRQWEPIPMMRQSILCGIGGGLQEEPSAAVPITLYEQPEERIIAGQVYKQRADEIHRSRPLCGTVTIVTRHNTADADYADVFWPEGTEWITAEPRPASPEEVYDILTNSLDTWFTS
jgi:hypothetical protein